VKAFKKGKEINAQHEDLKKRKIFVKGLPSSCDKQKLFEVFSKYGTVDKTYILYDHKNGASRGFGFVEFLHEEDLQRALNASIVIDSKVIKCSPVLLKQEVKQSHGTQGEDPSEGCEFEPDTYSTEYQHEPPTPQATDKPKPKPLSKIQIWREDPKRRDEHTKESSGASSKENEYRDWWASPNSPTPDHFDWDEEAGSIPVPANHSIFRPQFYSTSHTPAFSKDLSLHPEREWTRIEDQYRSLGSSLQSHFANNHNHNFQQSAFQSTSKFRFNSFGQDTNLVPFSSGERECIASPTEPRGKQPAGPKEQPAPQSAFGPKQPDLPDARRPGASYYRMF
jgi:RNA recognition motif-containing protein